MKPMFTGVRERKQWLLKHMGKGADAPATMVAAFGQEEDRYALERILSPCRWNLIWRSTCATVVEAVRESAAPIVISDRVLSDGSWRELWDRLRGVQNPPLFILGSRLADESLWAELLNRGGYNLLSIPFDPEEVIRTVHGALLQCATAQSGELRHCGHDMPAHGQA